MQLYTTKYHKTCYVKGKDQIGKSPAIFNDKNILQALIHYQLIQQQNKQKSNENS